MFVLWVYLLSCAFGQVEPCAFNCSLHGMCVGEACSCTSPWSSEDCSVLSLGSLACGFSSVGVTSFMGQGDQLLFALPVATPLVRITVQVPNLALFARLNAPPSPVLYDATSSSGALVLDAGDKGGAWQVLALQAQDIVLLNVSLALTCAAPCPNNCSQNGMCISGVCQCNSAHFGPDCSLWQVGLSVDTPFLFNCSESQWPTLLFQLPPVHARVPALRVSIQASDAGSSVIVAAGRIPSRVDYDYLLNQVSPSFVLTGSTAVAAPWSARVRVCASGTVSLSFSVFAACPNNCFAPERGSCDVAASNCLCIPPYQLPDCRQYVDALDDGEQRTQKLLHAGQLHLFALGVGQAPASGLSVQLKASVPGLVLLLKQGDQPPDELTYDLMAESNGTDVPAVLRAGWQVPLLPGSYWAAVLAPLGLDAQFPVDYQLSFSLSHKCPGGCTSAGHGTCLAGGVCACVAPWVLGDCSALSQPVLPDRVLSGRARVSQWDFYHIQIHSGNAVLVQMRELENGLNGLIWLFVRFDNLPTLADYLSADMQHGTSHTTLVRSKQSSENSTLYIGVYGSSRMPPGTFANYSLSVTTGCKTYSECDRCVSDPDCGWCLPQPFNSSVGQCVAGTVDGPFAGTGICGTWTFSTCNVGAQQAFVLNLGIIVGVAIGVLVLSAIAIVAFVVARRMQDEEQQRLQMLQNLDREED